MSLKFTAFGLTHSNAIFTDAVESIVNIIASLFAFYSIYLANQPLDKNHLYGHGKIEFFSSGIEGLLIFCAGLGTMIPAILNLFGKPKPLENILVGLMLSILVMFINGGAGYLIFKNGIRMRSIALEADGKHLMVDSLSTLISSFALILVYFTNNAILDSIIAILLGAYIIYSGYQILRKSVGGLMDETDQELVEHLVGILNKIRKDNWIDVHNFKVMRYGSDIHIDCHLTLPFYISLEEAHAEVVVFEKIVADKFGQNIDFFIHSDPCLPDCCHYCKVQNCSERKKPFEKLKDWTSERLIINEKHFNDGSSRS